MTSTGLGTESRKSTSGPVRGQIKRGSIGNGGEMSQGRKLGSTTHSLEASMSGTVSCPKCGHVLFAIELPIASAVKTRDVSQPDAPLLLRVPEAARLLGVSRSAMYELNGSGQLPVVRVGRSVRVVRSELEVWVEAAT
jgi:excisionase family DNA binding protein